MNTIQLHKLHFFVFILSLLTFSICFEQTSLAVKIFYDGTPTQEQDVNTPQDEYYGGYDSGAAGAPAQIPSTDLTFSITPGNPANNVLNIFGSGLADAVNANSVLGDIQLNVTDTIADGIYGGGETNGGRIDIGDRIKVTLDRCTVNGNLFGGSLLSGGAGRQYINRYISMDIVNSIVGTVMGAGNVMGTGPNNTAVNGKVDIFVVNSTITDIWLTSQADNVNVNGDILFEISRNSTIDNLFVTHNSNIGGNVSLTFINSTLNGDLGITNNGTIAGNVAIVCDQLNHTAGTLWLGPQGIGAIRGDVTFTATNSNLQTMNAYPNSIGGIQDNIDITLTNTTVQTLNAGHLGTTRNFKLQMNNSNATNEISLGGDGVIDNLHATILGGNIDSLTAGGDNAGAVNQADININGTRFRRIFLGGSGTLNTLNLDIKNSMITGQFTLSSDNLNLATITADHLTANDIRIVDRNMNTVTSTFTNSTINNFIIGRIGIINTITTAITDSTLHDFMLGGTADINTADTNLTNVTMNDMIIGSQGTLGTITTNLTNTTANNIIIGGPGNLTNGTTNITNGIISNLILGGDGRPNLLTTNIYSGRFNHIVLGGTTRLGTGVVNIHEGAFINTLTLGSTVQPGDVEVVIANIEGGDINNIITGYADNLTINFEPWDPSYVRYGISGPNAADTINIQKHARTHWGAPGNTFPVQTQDFLLAGELFIAEEATIELSIGGNFVADGGILIPESFLPTTSVPMIQFIGTPGSNLVLNTPLTVILAFSPDFLGVKSIPLATATPEFANPDLFAAQNRMSIIWSDTIFDKSTNTWYLTNIRASEDFYGFSAAREATNWLREQHIWTIQRRSSQLLDHGIEGLWINVQGGHEKLDAALGEAKMPWVMASMGYDFLKTLPSNMKAVYGFGLGVSKGDNKWSTVNTTKNDILMGMLTGYAGLMHNSGVYSTLTAQFAVGSITTKCTGFSKNYKWKEMIPTEALEFGWQHTFENGFKINPRGQVICEQLAKNHFKLPYENDTATLDKSFLATMVAGVAGEYSFQTTTPLHLQASVDWMQGVAGDFAAKSRILKTTFKDKNDSTVIRSSLGLHSQLRENFGIHCDIFADVGNDKGVGGQLGATYTF